jgi:hypothetical protein
VATYVQVDEDAFPTPTPTDTNPSPGPFISNIVSVYCDVYCYSSMEGMRECMLRRCLVSQPYGGLHEGHVWKPRAARLDLSGGDVGANTVEPRDLDGDHVLVTFMDDLITQPVIIRAVPHPRLDPGNEDAPSGQRMKLALADGEPDFWKHRGGFRGIDDKGNFLVDTTRAHGGEYGADGLETAKEDADHGNHTFMVPSTAKFTVVGLDKNRANPKFELVIEDNQYTLKLSDGESLAIVGKDGATTMKVGDGIKHVAIVEALEAKYDEMKDNFDGHVHSMAAHTHAVVTWPGGVAGPPAPSAPALPTDTVITTTPHPAWDPDINSTKVSIPDG